MKISSYGATLVGSSGINGDSFAISHDEKVFVLSDGASGAGKDGKVVMSRTCVEMAKEYDFAASDLGPREYLDSLFLKTNNKLIALSQEKRSRLFGTIIIAVIEKEVLTVTTFGDSPAFLFSDGVIKRVARNKKRYEELVEQGLVTCEEYEGYSKQMHERMGTCFDYFLPEVAPNNVIEQYTVKQGDMLFLCCDGLSDWIMPDEIFATLSAEGAENGTEKLIWQAKERALANQSYFDDITAIAVIFS